MKKIHVSSLILAAALVLLSACSSSRNAATVQTPASSELPRDLVAISNAVEPASGKETKSVLGSVVSLYTPWEEVSLDGKLSMKGLPIDPSAKIYMKRGTTILISVRAPIIGEVARIEIADGEVLMANRMKKIYAKVNLDRFLSKVDMSVTDVQDIFLGRVFLLGQGTLDASNASSMAVTEAPSDCWIITPKKQPSQANYGFTVTADYKLQILFAESIDSRYSANAEYIWRDNLGRKDVALTVTVGDKKYSPEFSFKAPNFSPNAMSRISLGKNWRQVSLREFMTSI